MKIQFDEPKRIILVREQKITIDEIEIIQMVDNPNEKKVIVITYLLGEIVLWQDADYDAIGQWTDQDVINRIKEIYGDV